jgi:hypothetical protein
MAPLGLPDPFPFRLSLLKGAIKDKCVAWTSLGFVVRRSWFGLFPAALLFPRGRVLFHGFPPFSKEFTFDLIFLLYIPNENESPRAVECCLGT